MDLFPEFNVDQMPPAPRHSFHSNYFRMLNQVQGCIAISARTAIDIHTRLRRTGPVQVVPPGVDHVTAALRSPGDEPSFVTVSTISPRKRIDVLVNGFIRAATSNPPMRLTVIGEAGSGADKTLDAIKEARHCGVCISWLSNATDEVIWDLLSKSTASFVLGQEGYGLAAPESLAAGCPVVVAPDLPSVTPFGSRGVLALPRVNEAQVMEAILELSDTTRANQLAAQIRSEDLPTWKYFADTVVDVVSGMS